MTVEQYNFRLALGINFLVLALLLALGIVAANGGLNDHTLDFDHGDPSVTQGGGTSGGT